MLEPQNEWKKNPYAQHIRSVSSDIAAEVIGRTHPEALERFGMGKIARRAFSKVAPLGALDEEFRDSMLILKGVAGAIRTRAESIDKALTLDEIATIISDAFVTQMTESQANVQPGHAAAVLEDAFGEHPSLLDRVSVAVHKTVIPALEELLELESGLECRVLKAIDDEETVSSAFVLCEGGHVLTAAHVAVDESKRHRALDLAFRYGGVRSSEEQVTGVPVVLEAFDTSLDFAILRLASQDWLELKRCGLFGGEGHQRRQRLKLALRHENGLRGHSVLCFGYQAQRTPNGHRIVDPSPVRATVASHSPVRNIAFQDEHGRVAHEQPCLVLVIAEGEERIGRGMSGGPIVELETGEIVGMTIGAQRPGRIHQPYRGTVEPLPLAEYGFGVLLKDVAAAWRGLESCCLIREAKPGGV